MTTPNHIIGGIVITGIFGSFLNINILTNPWYITTTIIASLLPDIDHPKSIIGKIFLPFSRYINRRFGHRTITHSLISLLVSSLLFIYTETSFFHSTHYAKIYLLAFSSHLILDMTTVQGVPLLYPFLKNPCVLPGNPDMRFRTGDLRSETMIFSFFLLSAIFLQPLFKNGFWTQYNRFFGTAKHLASEFRKSNDALFVKYTVKKGTEEIKGEGLCIEASDAKIVLLEKEGFHELNTKKYSIREVIPEHTGQSLRFRQISFLNISIDSLNQLVNEGPLKNINLQSNNKLLLQHRNSQEIKSKFKMDYPWGLWFSLSENPLCEDVSQLATDGNVLPTFTNPRIHTLQNQIRILEQQNQLAIKAYQNTQMKLSELKSEYTLTSDIVIQERILKEIKLLKKIKLSKINEHKPEELQLKIEELQLADFIKRQEKQSKLLENNKVVLAQETKITGFITRVLISSQSIAIGINNGSEAQFL